MKAINKFKKLSKNHYTAFDVLKNHIFDRYPVEYVDDTNDYSVLKKHNSSFVWLVNKNIKVLDTFPWWFKPTETDSIHVFPYVNKSKWHVRSWDMVKLVPTFTKTNKTIKHKYICGIHDTYNGKPHYDIFYIGNENSNQYNKLFLKFPAVKVVKNFEEAKEQSETDFFWLVPDDLIITDKFKFDYDPDDWSHDYIHVFKNGKHGNFDGIALFPKTSSPTKRELNYRFFTKKKEINVIASTPIEYEKFSFKNYQEYLNALQNSATEMFWFVPSDVNLDKNFTFSGSYDRSVNHTFLNGEHRDGVALFSKNSPVTEQEFLTRIYKEKKEWDILASIPKTFDKFTINNFSDYLLAKENSSTEMFYGIPSNVKVLESFKFDLYFPHNNRYDRNITHVFLNDTVYNGIALFSKNNSLSEKEIEYKFYIEKKEWPILASCPTNKPKLQDTSDAFTAWANGFIETVNLTNSLYSNGKINKHVKDKIYENCNVLKDNKFAEFYMMGSKEGKNYGLENIGEPDNLLKINNSEWLKTRFNRLNQLA